MTLCFRCNYEGTLKDLLVYFRPKQVKRIYYQRLTIPINELENKRQFKCTWMQDPPNGEEKELVLYPNRFNILLVSSEAFIYLFSSSGTPMSVICLSRPNPAGSWRPGRTCSAT